MNIEYFMIMATDALKKMDLSTALKAMRQIPTSDETWETQQLKGTILKLLGSFSEAVTVFESALILHPKDPALMTDMAESLAKMGEVTKAQRLLEEALQISPEYGEAHFQLGLLYFETAQFEEALPCFSAAVARMPTEASPFTLKARTLFALNDPQAESFFQQALQRNPKDPEAQYFLSEVYFEKGDIVKALVALEAVVALMPNHKEALHTLGFTYFNLSRFSEALPFLKKELMQDPNNTEIQLQISLCLTETGDAQSAIRMLEPLLQSDPNDVSLLCAKGMAQIKSKTYKEAMETLKHAAQIAPSDFMPFHYLGILFKDMMRYDDAIKAYSKAIALDPQNHDLHSALGGCFLATQRFAEATQSFQKAISISPQMITKLLLGRALLASGDTTAAEHVFSAAVLENPEIKSQVLTFKTMPLS